LNNRQPTNNNKQQPPTATPTIAVNTRQPTNSNKTTITDSYTNNPIINGQHFTDTLKASTNCNLRRQSLKINNRHLAIDSPQTSTNSSHRQLHRQLQSTTDNQQQNNNQRQLH
jgi:hypothetical protein